MRKKKLTIEEQRREKKVPVEFAKLHDLYRDMKERFNTSADMAGWRKTRSTFLCWWLGAAVRHEDYAEILKELGSIIIALREKEREDRNPFEEDPEEQEYLEEKSRRASEEHERGIEEATQAANLKAREDRLRRKARRAGMLVKKQRPYRDAQGGWGPQGYMLVVEESGFCLAGSNFELGIDAAEAQVAIEGE